MSLKKFFSRKPKDPAAAADQCLNAAADRLLADFAKEVKKSKTVKRLTAGGEKYEAQEIVYDGKAFNALSLEDIRRLAGFSRLQGICAQVEGTRLILVEREGKNVVAIGLSPSFDVKKARPAEARQKPRKNDSFDL